MKGKEEPWYTWVTDQGGSTRTVGQAPQGKGKGKGKPGKGPKGGDPYTGRDLDVELAEIAARPAGTGFVPYVRGADIPPPAGDPAFQAMDESEARATGRRAAEAAKASSGSKPSGPKGTYGAIRRGSEGWGSDERWT